MAYEDTSYESVLENSEVPFVWTEDAHSLYLTFLEDAFVNDLYLRHYCSPDICGCSPPFPSSLFVHASTAAAAESPSSADPSQVPVSMVARSEPEFKAETNARRRCPRVSVKASSSKRKGKWLPQDAGLENLVAGLENQQTFESTARLQDQKSLFEQPGSSSHSDFVVPKVLRSSSKRSRLKTKLDDIDRLGTDQVVPSFYDQG